MTLKIHREPEFIIYTGPMFGAKTSRLLTSIDRYKYQSRGVAAFMIDGSASAALMLFRSGKTIVVSSIQLSASGLPFDEVKEMMPYATKIEICPAVCPVTGRDAYYTERKRKDLGEIAVGGSDLYEPRCWEHHQFMNKRD